jgi:predicted heme/steroid binding protein
VTSRLPGNKNKRLAAILAVLIALLMTACGTPEQEMPAAPEQEPGAPEAEEPMLPDDELPVFTMEELSEFDGQDGRPTYVAVDGIVYDFTELPRWAGGTHQGFEAGQDLTEALHEDSPHGDRVLSRAEIVGRLEQ